MRWHALGCSNNVLWFNTLPPPTSSSSSSDYVQDRTKGNSIKVLKPNIDFEALMELGRYDSFHVHLLQYLQDEECDKLDQIWREVGQLLRKPIGLEQEDTIWWR